MKTTKAISLALLLASQVSFASTIAIVDSGVDTEHPDLINKVWTNSLDSIDGVDNDRNGYIDDFYGWNFTASNNKVINYKYLPLIDDEDIKKFRGITEGVKDFSDIPEEDVEWIKSTLKLRPEFLNDVAAFGSFTHGTHVAGIAAKGNDNAQIMAIKLLKTDVNDIAEDVADDAKSKNLHKKKGLKAWLAKKLVKLVAEKSQEQMFEIGKYVNGHKVDVVNGSYGTGFPQAQMAAKTVLSALSIFKDPRQKDIDKVAHQMVNTMIKEGAKFVEVAPNTLFIFAAGNDGLNNDVYPAAPTNIQRDNVISVAATDGTTSIASFSNYGVKTVDVAAPGVNIQSTIPGGGYTFMSGTSQAAPFVANVASQVKDENPELSPKQVKKIIMGTVTVKSFLKGKVKTSGIVNKDRALRAASLSKTMSVSGAIRLANKI